MTKENRKFLLNANEVDHVNHLWVNFTRVIVANDVLNDLFEVLLLGIKSNSLEKTDICLFWQFNPVNSEEIASQNVVLVLLLANFLGRDR